MALSTWIGANKAHVAAMTCGDASAEPTAEVDQVTAACNKVVAGFNRKLRFTATISCPDGSKSQQQLAAFVYQPLPQPYLVQGEPVLPPPQVKAVAQVNAP